MSVSYDVFAAAFLSKVTDYDFMRLSEEDRISMVDDYMKRACAQFNRLCKYDLLSCDDEARAFAADIASEDLGEIADIVSDGMLVQWLKPYLYRQENLENLLNTKDFTSYSPERLLARTKETHAEAEKHFVNRMREYSFSHGELGELHT